MCAYVVQEERAGASQASVIVFKFYSRKICPHFIIDFKNYFVVSFVMVEWAIDRLWGVG
jgi:hypothetical protein